MGGHSICVNSSDFERWDAKGLTFSEDLHNYAPAVWARTTKFLLLTLAREEHVCRGQTRPILRGGAQHPQISWEPLIDTHPVWHTATKFGMVRQVEDGRVSRGQPRAIS